MHRYKAVAQIFLFLSIVNFTFAGVAPTRTIDEMHVDLMTEAEERGHTQSEELPEWLGRPSTTVPLRSRLDPIPVPDGTPSTDPADPDEKKFFSKEMMKEVKEYFLLGGVYGVVAGITIGIQREISGEVSPGAYVFTSPCPLPSNTWVA